MKIFSRKASPRRGPPPASAPSVAATPLLLHVDVHRASGLARGTLNGHVRLAVAMDQLRFTTSKF